MSIHATLLNMFLFRAPNSVRVVPNPWCVVWCASSWISQGHAAVANLMEPSPFSPNLLTCPPDSTFEEALLDGTRCKVFAFDPTVGGIASGKGYANTLFVDSHGKPLPNTSGFVVQPMAERSVFFEKIALGRSSGGAGPQHRQEGREEREGSTHMHLLAETVLDGMRRHNVSFVDVLKVDVEGGVYV